MESASRIYWANRAGCCAIFSNGTLKLISLRRLKRTVSIEAVTIFVMDWNFSSGILKEKGVDAAQIFGMNTCHLQGWIFSKKGVDAARFSWTTKDYRLQQGILGKRGSMLRDFLEWFVIVIFVWKFREKGGRCCLIFWKNRDWDDEEERLKMSESWRFYWKW